LSPDFSHATKELTVSFVLTLTRCLGSLTLLLALGGCAFGGLNFGVSLPIGRNAGVGVNVGTDGRIGTSVGVGVGGGSVSVGTSAKLPPASPKSADTTDPKDR
jgi:hypothetical protein